MAGISSKALAFGEPKNKEQTFQGQRFDDELDLNWVQFKWRNHDPQIGRFIEVDPLAEGYVYNSTYAFSENKVISHVELEGLEAVEIIVGTGAGVGLGTAIGAAFVAAPIAAVVTHPEILLSGGASAAQMDFRVERQLAKAHKEAAQETSAPQTGQSADNSGTVGKAAAELGGRGKNNRKPDPEATGDHTVSNDRGSTTYKKNDKNPSGFDEVKRVDTKGKPHNGVPTPHVVERDQKTNKKLPVRPAKEEEIPKTNLDKNKP